MASRPANAGSGSHRATGPRPVRGRGVPGRAVPGRDRDEPVETGGLAWVLYLLVLAGAAVGMFVASMGSAYAGRGTALLGGTLLAAALARLVLPNRFAGVLASRRKASDVLAFAVFGAAVLAVALSLP